MERRPLPTTDYKLEPRGFFLHSGTVEIYTGNTIDVLRTLPANKFQCVVTSPPYWGLRDYGTATWHGGDPNCEHVGSVMRTGPAGSAKQASNTGAISVRSGDCACGAVRIDQQIGLETTPTEYVANLVKVFREVRRVLRDDGIVFLNLGDSYAANGGAHQFGSYDGGVGRAMSAGQPRRSPSGIKPKDLIGIPWRVAFALQDDGWWLRSDIIWAKPNPMPESIDDRPTGSHEYIFMLTKRANYYWDAEAVKEKGVILAGTLAAKGSPERRAITEINARPPEYKEYDGFRNIRDVWTIQTEPYEGAHFATMPTKIVDICVRASTSEQDHVLDPFGGSGTTGMTAALLARHATLIELSSDYVRMANNRISRELVPVVLK